MRAAFEQENFLMGGIFLAWFHCKIHTRNVTKWRGWRNFPNRSIFVFRGTGLALDQGFYRNGLHGRSCGVTAIFAHTVRLHVRMRCRYLAHWKLAIRSNFGSVSSAIHATVVVCGIAWKFRYRSCAVSEQWICLQTTRINLIMFSCLYCILYVSDYVAGFSNDQFALFFRFPEVNWASHFPILKDWFYRVSFKQLFCLWKYRNTRHWLFLGPDCHWNGCCSGRLNQFCLGNGSLPLHLMDKKSTIFFPLCIALLWLRL